MRYVLELPTELHAEMVQHIIDLNLTSKQIKDICDAGMQDTAEAIETEAPLPRGALQMARMALNAESTSPADIARALLQKERDGTGESSGIGAPLSD